MTDLKRRYWLRTDNDDTLEVLETDDGADISILKDNGDNVDVLLSQEDVAHFIAALHRTSRIKPKDIPTDP